MQTDLSGKVAVVTGAGGVLCSYLAKVLARAGAKVALVNRSDGAINQYAAEIVEEGGIAKAAVSNFTQWLAVHFSRCNIRVNAIAPGFFASKQNQSLLFLLDDKAAGFITGVVLPIDGGFSAYSGV